MKTEKWFCLSSEGYIEYLGEHDSFDSAENASEKAGIETIWIIDEETAVNWMQAFKSHLNDNN